LLVDPDEAHLKKFLDVDADAAFDAYWTAPVVLKMPFMIIKR